MSQEGSRIIHEPGEMMQTAVPMMQTEVPNIPEAGGMSRPEIRMMQIPGRKAGNAGKAARQSVAIITLEALMTA
jgi:hypothetical protein